MSPARAPSYEQAAWSWTEHLRSGGATTWTDWVLSGAGAESPVPDGFVVAGAAQLELVRRVAAARAAGRPEAPDVPPGLLADVVLGRSGPGRGLAQQPLSWGAPSSGRRFGAPPADPSDVPVEELVRVGVGALAELLLRGPQAEGGSPEPRRSRLTRAPAFHVAGAPVISSVVRRTLAAAGHLEGGASPTVLLLAGPFDQALAQVWSARVQGGAPVRWHGFVARTCGRRELPPAVDLPATARRWAGEVGPARVHVVVPDALPDAPRTAAAVLGVRLRPRRRARVPSGCHDLSPAAVDVLRRVNAVLNVRVPDDRHSSLVRRLSAVLARVTGSSGALTVPARFQDWAAAEARAIADDLGRHGYPVHGDLSRIVPRFGGDVATHPDRSEVLQVVVAACLAQAADSLHHDRTTGEAQQR